MNELLNRLKLAVERPQAENVSVRFLADLHGESAHGALLLFLSVLTLLPIPFSGMLFSLGVWAIAFKMWSNTGGHGLPDLVCRVQLTPVLATRLIKLLSWIYTKADRLCKPRLEALANPANTTWLVPFIALMGLVMFIPIPGGNSLPAFALVFIGLGLMAKDGFAILAGLVTGVAGIGLITFLGWMIVRLVDFTPFS